MSRYASIVSAYPTETGTDYILIPVCCETSVLFNHAVYYKDNVGE
jgi:hypothetical protein